jgi:hypothetical protein
MEILSQTDVMVEPHWLVWVFIGSIVCLGLSIIIGVENLSGWMSDAAGIVTFIVFLVGLVGLGYSTYAHENIRIDSGRDRYEVLLNEKVDMEEFYSKYEIIEKKDKIWVIEDKEAK